MIPALSIRQPWAWLVVHGGKNIENRSWNTGYRGRFQVHATATNLEEEYASAQSLITQRGIEIILPPAEDLIAKAILGTVFLDKISPTADLSPWGDRLLWEKHHQWGMPSSRFWWHLSRPVPWTPDPGSCSGQVGWFFPIN